MSLPLQKTQEEAEKAIKRGQIFIDQTRTKMKQLVDDFANGKLNREQFHTLYDRYQSQINGVKLLLAENDPTMWMDALDGDQTLNIRKQLMAKAKGMLIYLNRQGTLLDRLGRSAIDGREIARAMKMFKEKIATETIPLEEDQPQTATRHRYHQMVVESASGGWLFVMKGQYTTIITFFSREPTQDQRDTMLRLIRDFETANSSHLRKPSVRVEDLAMPFQVFVKRETK